MVYLSNNFSFNSDEKCYIAHNKWIIKDNILIMGNVSLHRDLVKEHSGIIGGGYFHKVEKLKVIFFLF